MSVVLRQKECVEKKEETNEGTVIWIKQERRSREVHDHDLLTMVLTAMIFLDGQKHTSVVPFNFNAGLG